MALDLKTKSELARKAALVLAEKRREKNKERNEDICLAFRYLSKDESLFGKEKSAAFQVLLKPKYKGWDKTEQTPKCFLANAHKLTWDGIDYIIRKSLK